MTSDLSVMKRLARQLWGAINHQKKLALGVYSFGCAAHGGIIVDYHKFEVPERLLKFKKRVWLRKGSNKYYPDEQHFLVFEEDNDYKIFLEEFPRLDWRRERPTLA